MCSPKFDTTVILGDGNAWAIMGAVSSGMREAGATKKDIDEYTNAAMSGDYDNLLRVSAEQVNLETNDND